MRIERIRCDGCGQIRRWRGVECLDPCPCLDRNRFPDTNEVQAAIDGSEEKSEANNDTE